MIKFIPVFGLKPGLPPAVCIYLRKPDDIPYWEKEATITRKQVVKGYPRVIGFFAPDYSKNKSDVIQDSRKTLYWNPHVDVMNGKTEIEFYNNDNSKKFIVVVEGIAADGRPVHFKKNYRIK